MLAWCFLCIPVQLCITELCYVIILTVDNEALRLHMLAAGLQLPHGHRWTRN